MKHLRKLTAALAAAALFLALVPAAAASEVYGQEIKTKTVPVAPGTTVTAQAVWAPNSQVPRAEHYLTYSPNGTVKPVVRWGDYLLSRRTLDQMAQTLESEGLRVVGGINASFYDVSNGCPIGVVVSGGRLIAANPEFQVVGFRADGSALLGQPTVAISAAWTVPEQTVTGEDGAETVIPAQDKHIPLAGLNKVRLAGGYYLISGDYASGTQNTLDGVDVILRPEEAQRGLPLQGDVACEVLAVRSSLADTSIPEGCFVLSMNAYSDAALVAVLQELQAGDKLTLSVSVTQGWEEVTEALSGLYGLIVNGSPNPELPKDGRAPRTAVGLRADGTVVFYTIDGRKSGYSVGATYTEVAWRMLELGCVSAIALDGGGSTTFGTTWPDSEEFQTINRPSDGAARAVSVCLFLAEDAQTATGELGSFAVRVDGPVLTGGSVPVSALPVDTAGRAMAWSGELSWTAALGSVAPDGAGGWTYTAPASGGTDTLTVTGGGASGTASVTVAAPTALSVTDPAGKAVTALDLKAGETARLFAEAKLHSWPLLGGGFTWSVSPEVGTVDETGLFAAGEKGGSGVLTVTAGDVAATVPVTVAPPETPEDPFADISGHWASESILKLYSLGINQGTVEADGLRYFHPGNHITRQEWMVYLIKFQGVDPAKYEDTALPFADTDSIASWALPYIRAAYALELMSGAQTGQGLMANPTAEITREEVMTMVGRALGETQEADLSVFSDGGEVSPWAAPYVQSLVARGIVSGSGGKLSPKDLLTRAEAAQLLCGMLPE